MGWRWQTLIVCLQINLLLASCSREDLEGSLPESPTEDPASEPPDETPAETPANTPASPVPDPTPDLDSTTPPEATLEPAPTDEPAPADEDGDGYAQDIDCDDQAKSIYPGAVEVCDDLDNDCDASVDEDLPTYNWYPDADGDGFGNLWGGVTSCQTIVSFIHDAGDCDDTASTVFPANPERCDGLDNDCSGIADDGLLVRYYPDEDGDGFGSTDGEFLACAVNEGAVEVRGDCDDADFDVYPGALDLADDGRDQDCGGNNGPDSHVGLGNYSSRNIQDAIAEAGEGGTIWVGPGTYLEHDLSFAGRDLTLMSTHLSDQTVIDSNSTGRVFVFDSGESDLAGLDGFTLTGGYILDEDGAGLLIVMSSPSIRNCTIKGNRVAGADRAGGGVYLFESNARFDNCVILDNEAEYYGAGAHADYSTPTFVDCQFRSNYAGQYGGGSYLIYSDATFRRCQFSTNSSDAYGGGLAMFSSNPDIEYCDFDDNVATLGGAVHVFYTSAPHFFATNFTRNTAYSLGGAAYIDFSSGRLDRCLFFDNGAARGGGAYVYSSSPSVTNSVFLANRASTAGGGLYLSEPRSKPELLLSILAENSNVDLVNDEAAPSNATIHYNALYQEDSSTTHNFTLDATNLSANPFLVSLGQDNAPIDLHLRTTSPLWDGGDPDVFDDDGSRSDIGLFGGPGGATLDRDGDLAPDWFWPGSYETPPSGYYPENFDCYERDRRRQKCP